MACFLNPLKQQDIFENTLEMLMKRFSLFLMALFMMAALAACSRSARDDTPPQGMYTGTLPCADCSGIKTAITFNSDGSVVETSLYENTDGASLSQSGTWKMDKGIVTVTFPFDTQYFVVNRQTPLK